MGYSVSLNISTGAETHARAFERNHTSNTARMWITAGCDVVKLHEKPAVEAAPLLRLAVEAMEAEPAKYQAMNPDNGWGSYESALAFLRDILEACVVHPATIVWVH